MLNAFFLLKTINNHNHYEANHPMHYYTPLKYKNNQNSNEELNINTIKMSTIVYITITSHRKKEQ